MLNPLEEHLKTQLEISRDFFWHRLRWFALKGWLPERQSFELLDVGAGAGFVGEYLREDRPEAKYRFIEPFASLETSLAKRFGSDANLASATNYAGVRRVTLLDVLEHQEFDRAFIDGLVSKLDSGAILLITVPAGSFLWSHWDELFGHFRRYSKATLRAALANPKLELLEVSYLFPEMLPLALVRKWSQSSKAGNEKEGDFPQIPHWLNSFLIGLGKLSLAVRRWVPMGTSLLAVVRVR